MFQQLGTDLGNALFNKTGESFDSINEEVQTLEDNYGDVGRNICKSAAVLLEVVGDTNCVEYQMFNKFANVEQWYPEFNKLPKAVLKALRDDVNMQKSSNGNSPVPGLGWAASAVGGGIHGLLTAALLTGVVGGGGAWLLDQDIKRDSYENEVLEEKRKEYERLVHKIKNEIKRQYGEDFNSVVDYD